MEPGNGKRRERFEVELLADGAHREKPAMRSTSSGGKVSSVSKVRWLQLKIETICNSTAMMVIDTMHRRRADLQFCEGVWKPQMDWLVVGWLAEIFQRDYM